MRWRRQVGRILMSMLAIELHGVHKCFPPAAPLLRGVDLLLSAGETVALLGPSGCGKTTILRIIAGLETVDRGEVRLRGQKAHDLPPHERDVALAGQLPVLHPQLNVRENLAIGWRIHRKSFASWWSGSREPVELRQRLDEVAALLELSPVLDQRPATLSGGQKQRVVLGRCLVRRPAVFLLDEPLAYLDAALADRVRMRLQAAFAAWGSTVVWVTHDAAQAVAIAERRLRLADGQLRTAWNVDAPPDSTPQVMS